MKPSKDFPIRLTVCDNADQVRRLVKDLQQAGFTAEEISVVCSQEACQREFAEFIHENPAGSQTDDALAKSGLSALGLGTAAVIVGILTSPGTAIVAVGAFSGLAIAGTFAAMMMTRGAEKELADFYDQSITHGKMIVAVETVNEARQRLADEILGRQGSRPTALPSESPTNE